MQNPESVLENEMHKFHYDYKIQTDHLFAARRPDQVIIINKRELDELQTCCSGSPKSKIERKRKER